jgi:hypothetical protein
LSLKVDFAMQRMVRPCRCELVEQGGGFGMLFGLFVQQTRG